jgi:hypothetical protein
MLLREAALVLTQGNGGGSYITCVEFALKPSRGVASPSRSAYRGESDDLDEGSGFSFLNQRDILSDLKDAADPQPRCWLNDGVPTNGGSRP